MGDWFERWVWSIAADRKTPAWLGSLGVAAQAAFVLHRGIQYGGDSPAYLACWRFVAERGWSIPFPPEGLRAFFYPGYCALGGGLLSVGLAAEGAARLIVAMQVAAAGLVPLFAFLALRVKHPGAAVGAAAITLVIPDLYRWTPYVLTDAFYLAWMGALPFLVLCAAQASSRTIAIAAAIGIISGGLTRPSGIIMVAGLGLALLVVGWRAGARRLLVVGSCVVILIVLLTGWLLLVVRVHESQGMEGFVDAARAGVVMHGRPEYDRPWPATAPDWQTVAHGVHLMGMRAWYLFSPAYPHHSTRHQIANVLVYLPIYLLGLTGLARWWSTGGVADPSLIVVTLGVGIHVGIVLLTFVEPDHRFLAHVLPLLVILAGRGVAWSRVR